MPLPMYKIILTFLVLFVPSFASADFIINYGNVQTNNPADAVNYYVSANILGFTSTACDNVANNNYYQYNGSDAVITSVFSNYNVQGTFSSAESITIYLYKNGVDTTLGTLSLSGSSRSNYFSTSSLSIPITSGDKFCIHELNPTWATNPTNVIRNYSLYVTQSTGTSSSSGSGTTTYVTFGTSSLISSNLDILAINSSFILLLATFFICFIVCIWIWKLLTA